MYYYWVFNIVCRFFSVFHMHQSYSLFWGIFPLNRKPQSVKGQARQPIKKTKQKKKHHKFAYLTRKSNSLCASHISTVCCRSCPKSTTWNVVESCMPGRREHSIFKPLMMPIKSLEQLEHIFRKVIAETLFPVQTPFAVIDWDLNKLQTFITWRWDKVLLLRF